MNHFVGIKWSIRRLIRRRPHLRASATTVRGPNVLAVVELRRKTEIRRHPLAWGNLLQGGLGGSKLGMPRLPRILLPGIRKLTSGFQRQESLYF
jgi:hypothetical protein